MAVVPITRDHVHAWLIEFRQQSEIADLRQWMTDKLGEYAQVQVKGQSVIDRLMDDMDSYVVDDDAD